jgi:hypothetical protein
MLREWKRTKLTEIAFWKRKDDTKGDVERKRSRGGRGRGNR